MPRRSILTTPVAVLLLQSALACQSADAPSVSAHPATPATADAPSSEPAAAEPPLAATPLDAQLAEVLARRGDNSVAVVLSIESGKVLGHAQHKIEFADAHEHGRWHPASTMKPLLAWHALEAAGWSGSRLVNCRGEKPDKKGNYCFSKHGDLDLATAIATSCNAYFFPMAESLGTAGIKEVFHRAGLDSSTMTAPNKRPRNEGITQTVTTNTLPAPCPAPQPASAYAAVLASLRWRRQNPSEAFVAHVRENFAGLASATASD